MDEEKGFMDEMEGFTDEAKGYMDETKGYRDEKGINCRRIDAVMDDLYGGKRRRSLGCAAFARSGIV